MCVGMRESLVWVGCVRLFILFFLFPETQGRRSREGQEGQAKIEGKDNRIGTATGEVAEVEGAGDGRSVEHSHCKGDQEIEAEEGPGLQ